MSNKTVPECFLTQEIEDSLRLIARNFIERVIEENKGPLKNSIKEVKSNK